MGRAKSARKWALLGAAGVAALAGAGPALAQDASDGDIIVTGTRRAVSVQDVPLNISAVGGQQLEEQGIGELSELLRIVPGAQLIDMGGRDSNRIVVRGLNSSPLGSSEGVGTTAGGTVATYFGEMPLFVDLALNDIERVEVLLGPQGTLYGSGTLGGAIRYIPNRPEFEESSISYRGDAYQYSEADGISNDFGLTANIPLLSNMALRFSIDRSEDTGFIDQTHLVNFAGLLESTAIGGISPNQSFPNILDPSDPDYSLHREEDTNWEDMISGRVALRWSPTPWLDGTLTYFQQEHEVGSRQISTMRGTVPTGEYENAKRVLEPNDRNTEVLALEVVADLGFAELTASAGNSMYRERGQRDQTDLLISLDYLSYLEFPQFTAYTREYAEEEVSTAELRLVSQDDGPFSWIVGGFFSTLNNYGESSEFVPGFESFGWDGNVRDDDLEYYQLTYESLEEQGIFGEASYQLTDRWQVTLGTRWYSYELVTDGGFALPIADTDAGAYGPDEIVVALEPGGQSDEGWLFKFNTSYDFSEDVMGYLTVSEGYRIGSSNGVAPCPDPLPPGQVVCALPNETEYLPDSTLNYEIGLRSEWFDGRLLLNTAAYYIEWDSPQVDSATVNGLAPITKNGEGAVSTGIEVNFSADITDNWNIRGAYANTRSELSATAFALIGTFDPLLTGPSEVIFLNGEDGDRLPGYAPHTASLFTSYTLPMSNGLEWEFSYGVNYVGEVLTRTGGRGGGFALPDYTLHDAAVTLRGDQWNLSLYGANIFDEFYETGSVSTTNSNIWGATVVDDNGDPVYYRAHYTAVGPPRRIGVRLGYEFGG